MLGLSELKQTRVYQEAREEGFEEGIEQGIERGQLQAKLGMIRRLQQRVQPGGNCRLLELDLATIRISSGTVLNTIPVSNYQI